MTMALSVQSLYLKKSNKMNPSLKNTLITSVSIIIIIALISVAIYLILIWDAEETAIQNQVAEIIDGDTFRLVNGDRIRLLCVNTPEKGKAGYDEAASFLGGRLLYENLVLIGNKTDRYGRLLRFVYTNGSLVNKEIIDQGYGKLFIYDDSDECELVS
jgi:micrococcal nuclease